MDKCQVIITLGGTGKRFSDAGYELPKYMLPINPSDTNSKVIDLIAKMYKDTDVDIIFLCNKDHIERYGLNSLLNIYGRVVPVAPGKGPGDAIYQSAKYINLNKPTFVQYCDTFQPWDLEEIKLYIKKHNPDAAVAVTNEKCPSVYDGTLYGRVRIKDNTVEDIKEKAEPEYSDYLGCGSFYFRDGATLLKYIKIQNSNKEKYYLNGESYINCTIKAMLDDNNYVIPINITGYLNLGVPRDYEDFMYWNKLDYTYSLKQTSEQKTIIDSTIIMPAAGLGSRFKNTYNKPKPLISVKPQTLSPMYVEAIKNSFNPDNVVIVSRKDLDFYNEFKDTAESRGYTFLGLDKITDGQAITIREGLNKVHTNGPVIINSCDQGILYNEILFSKLFDSADIVICGLKNYQPALLNVSSFSWIKNSGTDVIAVTSKRCDDDPKNSLVFISCLIYKSKEILENSIESLVNRRAKINGEYYIDESINDSILLGYNVKVLEIDAYLNWGTPEELELFQWWNRFFAKVRLDDYLA